MTALQRASANATVCLCLGLSVFARYGQQHTPTAASEFLLMLSMSSISTYSLTQEPVSFWCFVSVLRALYSNWNYWWRRWCCLWQCWWCWWCALVVSEAICKSVFDVVREFADALIFGSCSSLWWLFVVDSLLADFASAANLSGWCNAKIMLKKERGMADDNEQEQKARARLASS